MQLKTFHVHNLQYTYFSHPTEDNATKNLCAFIQTSEADRRKKAPWWKPCWTNHLLINWCSSCKIFCKSQDKGKMSMGFCAQGEMISDTFDQWLGWYGMEGKVVDMIWKICNIWKIWLIWYGRETRWVEMIWIWIWYGRDMEDMIWYDMEGSTCSGSPRKVSSCSAIPGTGSRQIFTKIQK